MQVSNITLAKIQHNNSLQIKRNDVPTEETKTTILPSFIDAKSFVNINFKAAIHDYARMGDWEGIQRELDKGVDINLQDSDDWTALLSAALYGHDKVVEKLLQHPKINVNIQNTLGRTALLVAAWNGHEKVVEKLLQHPDIDITLKDSEGDDAIDKANRIEHHKIVQMLKYYKRGVDRREGVIKQEPNKLDIEKLTSYKEIWSNEEKQNIQKFIDENNYSGVVKLLESKGVELNRDYEQFKEQMSTIKEETEKFVRETVTEKIREEERINAKKELEEKFDEAEKKNVTLNNLINNYKSLLAEDVEYAKNGFRALYGIEAEELPETLDFGGQMTNVISVLAKRKNKLDALNSGVAEKITKSLQNNNGNISIDGLKFLERIIDASEERCDADSLTNSIQSVKGEGGFIDTGKAGLFVSILSMGGISLRNVIKEVGKYSIK